MAPGRVPSISFDKVSSALPCRTSGFASLVWAIAWLPPCLPVTCLVHSTSCRQPHTSCIAEARCVCVAPTWSACYLCSRRKPACFTGGACWALLVHCLRHVRLFKTSMALFMHLLQLRPLRPPHCMIYALTAWCPLRSLHVAHATCTGFVMSSTGWSSSSVHVLRRRRSCWQLLWRRRSKTSRHRHPGSRAAWRWPWSTSATGEGLSSCSAVAHCGVVVAVSSAVLVACGRCGCI